MPVLVWSRRFTADGDLRRQAMERWDIDVLGSAEKVAAHSDIVSIHLALTKDTRGFVDAEVLRHLRPGATLINTARAKCSITALTETIREKGLRVGLDVFAHEPNGAEGQFDDPSCRCPM